MKLLNTAFGQLAFAWKLHNYGCNDKINYEELDEEITYKDGAMVFVVPKALQSPDDLIIALENNLGIAFGAAAITLNKVREKMKIPSPNPIESENDQCVALIYQIRNAFAHDIAEPTWEMKERYKRTYEFGRMKFDLTDLNGEPFSYEQIGGPGKLFRIKDFFSSTFGEL